MNRMIWIFIVLGLFFSVSNVSAQEITKTIEQAKIEVSFIEANDRGRLMVYDQECYPECPVQIFVVERSLPVFVNIDEPITMDEFISIRRGVADVQYDIATQKLLKVRLQ